MCDKSNFQIPHICKIRLDTCALGIEGLISVKGFSDSMHCGCVLILGLHGSRAGVQLSTCSQRSHLRFPNRTF